MVAPVTGPIVTSASLPPTNGQPAQWSYLLQKSTYKQKPPFDRPLARSYLMNRLVRMPNPWWTDAKLPNLTAAERLSDPSSEAQAYSRAYGELREAIYGETSQNAVNYVERSLALGLVVDSATRLLRFSRSLRKLRFLEAAEHLGLVGTVVNRSRTSVRMRVTGHGRTRTITLKRTSQAFAGNWLAFHFGWEPTVKDIYTSLQILQDPNEVKTFTCTGKGTKSFDFDKRPSLSLGGLTHLPKGRVSVRLGAEVTVNNPNFSLLTKLGLVNPLGVVWELIPFSFLVDWFANVSQFLESFTDFVGYTLTNKYTTIYYRGHKTGWYRNSQYGDITSSFRRITIVTIDRTLTINAPKLTFRPPKQLSVTRGATAIALLVGFLKK